MLIYTYYSRFVINNEKNCKHQDEHIPMMISIFLVFYLLHNLGEITILFFVKEAVHLIHLHLCLQQPVVRFQLKRFQLL